jgi:hypothetical protein
MVPEEDEDALQLLVTAEEIDPRREGACDRWLIYHLDAPWPHWAALVIDAAKLGDEVHDGEALMRPDPLRESGPALCKWLNADRDRLADLCRAATGVEPASPVCVGVDAHGVDVRARFGIIRVVFDVAAGDEASARQAVRRMLEG